MAATCKLTKVINDSFCECSDKKVYLLLILKFRGRQVDWLGRIGKGRLKRKKMLIKAIKIWYLENFEADKLQLLMTRLLLLSLSLLQQIMAKSLILNGQHPIGEISPAHGYSCNIWIAVTFGRDIRKGRIYTALFHSY